MEQEHYITIMKKGNERKYFEGRMWDYLRDIFDFTPDMITQTKVSEKELERLRTNNKELVQKLLELYI